MTNATNTETEMMTATNTTESLDIRDIDPGQTYYAIVDASRGGRCVMNGMFIAVWLDKAEAKKQTSGNPDLTVVRCRKPE